MNTNTEQTNTEQAEGLSMGQAVEQADNEQAAALASLMSKVEPEQGAAPAGLNYSGADGAGVDQEPQRVPLAEEIGDAINAAVSMLEPIFPTLQKVYTPAKVQAIGKATERVLAGVLVPIAFGTWAAVRSDLVAARVAEKPWIGWAQRVRGWFGGKRQDEGQGEASAAPGAASVTLGTVAAA
jgi:hypothetical protein